VLPRLLAEIERGVLLLREREGYGQGRGSGEKRREGRVRGRVPPLTLI